MDLLMTGIDCYKQKRAGSIKSAAGPVFAQTGFYSMAVSGWKTFTSLRSSDIFLSIFITPLFVTNRTEKIKLLNP